MTEAQWINSSTHELALQTKRLLSLHRALPQDSNVKVLLRNSIQEIRNKGLVRQSALRQSFEQIDREWDNIFNQVG